MREEQVNIVARVTAFLEKQLFVERSDVKKGDLPDRLKQPPYQAAVDVQNLAVAQLSRWTFACGMRRTLPTSIVGVDHGEFDQGSVGGCHARRARRGVQLVCGADFQRRKASPGGSSGGLRSPRHR